MKYEWRNLIFVNFCDSNFLQPGLCSKLTGDFVNFARLADFSSGNSDHSKPCNSLVKKR